MGVVNENTLFTGLDNMGKMTCSDFDGNFKKTLVLDYMAKDIIAIDNEKFAIVGWVLWSKKIRSLISIVDYSTNDEKVIWEDFTDRLISSSGRVIKEREPFNYTAELDKGSRISCTTMPFSQSTGKGMSPKITSLNNELIVAVPNTGEILVFDFDGNLKSRDEIGWPITNISVEEQKLIQQKAIDRFEGYIESGDSEVQANVEAYKKIVSEMEKDLDNISQPLEKPSFSTIMKDSDGNILFFEIPEEKDANRFHVWVFNKGGKFEAECTFICDEYELNISPSKMVFKDGYIYGIQKLKETDGNPLRLVRFKLSSN